MTTEDVRIYEEILEKEAKEKFKKEFEKFKKQVRDFIEIEEKLEKSFGRRFDLFSLIKKRFNEMFFGFFSNVNINERMEMFLDVIKFLKSTGRKFYLTLSYVHEKRALVEIFFYYPKIDPWKRGLSFVSGSKLVEGPDIIGDQESFVILEKSMINLCEEKEFLSLQGLLEAYFNYLKYSLNDEYFDYEHKRRELKDIQCIACWTRKPGVKILEI